MSNIAGGLPQRGQTRYGTTGTIPATFGGDAVLEEGVEREFVDAPKASGGMGALGLRSGAMLRMKLVRNSHSTVILPGAVLKYKAGFLGRRVELNTTADGPCAGVADYHLPAAGVRVGDMFWMAVKGPHEVNKPTGGGTAQAEGGLIVSDASSRGVVANAPASDQESQDQATNALGRVRTASLDADTATLVTLDIRNN